MHGGWSVRHVARAGGVAAALGICAPPEICVSGRVQAVANFALTSFCTVGERLIVVLGAGRLATSPNRLLEVSETQRTRKRPDEHCGAARRVAVLLTLEQQECELMRGEVSTEAHKWPTTRASLLCHSRSCKGATPTNIAEKKRLGSTFTCSRSTNTVPYY